MTLDKKWFYENLKGFGSNKFTPIYMDIPLNKEDTRYRLIFDWNPRKSDGSFNPLMLAQLIDTQKSVGHGKYIVPDLFFNCFEKGILSDFKLYKFLKKWIEEAFDQVKENV